MTDALIGIKLRYIYFIYIYTLVSNICRIVI